MEKWTRIEAQSQHCTKSVVGTIKHYYPIDTLQHEWTAGDAQAGRCLPEEIGASRFPPHASLVPPEDYEPPENLEDEDDLTVQSEGPSSDWLRAAFKGMGGKRAFVAFCKKNPTLTWPMLIKNGLTQLLKEEPPPKRMEEYSLAELDNMSSVDIKRLLLGKKSEIG